MERTMKRREFLRNCSGLAFGGFLTPLIWSNSTGAVTSRPGPSSSRPLRPNLLLILADDMGFSDIGCFGGEIKTPNLDRLAGNGVCFTQMYNCGRCCPTRASLLTGLYPHQAGVGHMIAPHEEPGYIGHLNTQCITLAEALKPSGYFTIMTGKWHVGATSQEMLPSSRGFERSLFAGVGGYYFAEDEKAGDLFYNGKRMNEIDAPVVPDDFYTTDLWVDKGVEFLDESIAAGKPFFWYLAYNAPHFPVEAPKADVDKYSDFYRDAGWDRLRAERLERQVRSGVVNPQSEIAARPPDVPAWETLSEEEKNRLGRLMAIYAGAVDHLDQSVGKIIRALIERGQLENTLILFLSDNGSTAEMAKGSAKGDGSANSGIKIGKGWAALGNAPFRGFKKSVFEGGISTPCLVHWPSGVQDRGTLRHDPLHVVDIMPSFLQLAGAQYPEARDGVNVLPMEGISFLNILAGGSTPARTIFWEHERNAAARMGRWKIVREKDRSWELYDIEKDRSETLDLSDKHPEVVENLDKQWNEWAHRAFVFPSPDVANVQ